MAEVKSDQFVEYVKEYERARALAARERLESELGVSAAAAHADGDAPRRRGAAARSLLKRRPSSTFSLVSFPADKEDQHHQGPFAKSPASD
jgi:hypothetical protein